MLETAHRETGVADLRRKTSTRPPLPEDLGKVKLDENARTVLMKRYIRRGKMGQPLETVDEMFWRVAYHVAEAELEWDGNVVGTAKQFYELLTSKRFFPNSPTFTGAGTPLGQLAACFVLPISDDMGRDPSGIFQTLRDAALIQQTGGGNGFAFGKATGPVGFLRVYDQAFGEVAQGGTRRGANMAVLRVDHPDIREFVSCKADENQITNFNISVGVTDKFMQAVIEDTTYDLVAPSSGQVVESPKARDIFNLIVEHAHHNGEPGVLFIDAANRSNPLPHLYKLEATNPCGEQWLGPYENCCLGSVNLAQHQGPSGTIDWEKLRQSVVLATRFLDDVVTANAYVPAVPQLKEAAFRSRRIGLGIMGMADLMYHAKVRYGSQPGQEFAAQVMEFIRYHCMITSIELARQRGSFPAIEGSIYDPSNLTWETPQPVDSYRMDLRRPDIDWGEVVDGIREHGIRNAAQMTIAPTGTIATVAGCEGYGCEPIFALAYDRHVLDDGKDLTLSYTSPLFEKALIEAGLDVETRKQIIEKVSEKGTAQGLAEIPHEISEYAVVSQDITAEEHVRMQAALQAFVDNSLSKTCNFPQDATEDDVAKAYKLGWELGAKGLTVYVTGSRKRAVLETKSTAESRYGLDESAAQLRMWNEAKKPRPQRLDGSTYQINTPVGKAFVTKMAARSPLRFSSQRPKPDRRRRPYQKPSAGCSRTLCGSPHRSRRARGWRNWCANWPESAGVARWVLGRTGCCHCPMAWRRLWRPIWGKNPSGALPIRLPTRRRSPCPCGWGTYVRSAGPQPWCTRKAAGNATAAATANAEPGGIQIPRDRSDRFARTEGTAKPCPFGLKPSLRRTWRNISYWWQGTSAPARHPSPSAWESVWDG
jgi:ribonucleoside-diphosphate reductase alpha chain